MAADVEHGLDRYRVGCRCSVCRMANTTYMREYRAQRRGLSHLASQRDSSDSTRASVTTLSEPAIAEDVGPGAVEQGVIDRCATGDLVCAAQRMPDLVASCRALARILDDSRQVTTMPSAHRQLMLGVARLESAAAIGRRGRLAPVAQLAQRGPASGVG